MAFLNIFLNPFWRDPLVHFILSLGKQKSANAGIKELFSGTCKQTASWKEPFNYYNMSRSVELKLWLKKIHRLLFFFFWKMVTSTVFPMQNSHSHPFTIFWYNNLLTTVKSNQIMYIFGLKQCFLKYNLLIEHIWLYSHSMVYQIISQQIPFFLNRKTKLHI